MSRLQNYYKETVIPQLMKDLGIDNEMAVPRVEKITLRSTWIRESAH